MYLGIDFGKKRIGLSLGELLPRGAGVIDGAQNQDKIIDQITKICHDNEVSQVVLGMPIRSQGEKGTIASDIEAFAAKLSRRSGLPIDFQPEQFTSYEAKEELKSSGKNYTRKGGEVDELAAILILEQYIDQKNEK